MKTIIYGIFAEDEANKIFIQNTVNQLIEHWGYNENVKFEHETDFTSLVAAKNGKYVFEQFITVISIGVKRFSLELCFVGLDADDQSHDTWFNSMTARLKESGLECCTLIFIPVQAIEYWLWYIKVKKDSPAIASTPIVDASKTRKELKQLVYNRMKPTNKKSNPIVESLTQSIDFDWLNAHSSSFKHFYDLFNEYLKKNFGVNP